MRVIRDAGFDNFRKGTLGNAGQNIYVSKAGVLQRINLLDVNKDGYPDIPIANSHSDNSRVASNVFAYGDPTKKLASLYSEGSFCAAMADINGDGYNDLIIGHQFNGVSNINYAHVYYGDPAGFSLRRMLRLYAPGCTALTVGDFNGDGKKDIVFFGKGECYIYYQKANGILDGQYTLGKVPTGGLVEFADAYDIDGDGCDDLLVKFGDDTVMVIWGSEEGLNIDAPQVVYQGHNTTNKVKTDAAAQGGIGTLSTLLDFETYRMRVVSIDKKPYIFSVDNDDAVFWSFSGRTFAEALRIPTGSVCSVASGDINGDGYDDLVFVSLQPNAEGKEHALIYYGGANGFSSNQMEEIETWRVKDVVLYDKDKTGYSDVFFVQLPHNFDNERPVLHYKGGKNIDWSNPMEIPASACSAFFVDDSNREQGLITIVVNRNDSHNDGDEYSYIYLGGENGYSPERRIELKGWAPTEMKLCDFNDNGYPDVFISNDDENVSPVTGRLMPSYIYLQNESGFNSEQKIEIDSPHTMSTLVADIDKDGLLEIITAGYECTFIDIWHSDGKGGYTNQRIDLEVPVSSSGVKELSEEQLAEITETDESKRALQIARAKGLCVEPRFMCIGDVNNDGWLDIYIPFCDSKIASVILYGGPDGYSTERMQLLPIEYSICGKFYDLDGDGWLDLISGGLLGFHAGNPYMSNTTIYWGGPDGYSPDRRTSLPGYGTVDLTIADFNNDSIPDIFVCNYTGPFTRNLECYLYFGQEGGIYDHDNMYPIPLMSCAGALAMDFNGDGYVDLAVANHKTAGNHRGDSMILWNGPDGMSRTNVTHLPALGPHGLTHQDYTNIATGGWEEYFTSQILELDHTADVVDATWQGECPKGAWVTLTVRTADTVEALENAAFVDVKTAPRGKYAQYRLALGSKVGSTARVNAVEITVAE